MNLNIAPSPFDEDQDHQNPRGFSCQLFFDSTDRDRTKFYNHRQFNYPEDDCYNSYHGGSPYEDDTDDKVHSSLKLTLWSDPVKWKPSRVEPMRETETNVEEDRLALKINTGGRNINKVREDQKLRPSYSLETDLSSNSSCNNIVANANNTPTIRVCSDCNTTKTPLWRSGPKGPKSLCNACGIRQRKARRAMAVAVAAAAAAGDRPPPVLKIKVQQQNIKQKMRHGPDSNSKFKKRSKMTTSTAHDGSSSSSSVVPKKLEFEDFLIKVSKNSSNFQRVFPQDEKDAAILLMALSSGLVHG
ncbi:uncharacterized protein [Henckelia pumila]|uniref:uncharacterized protein n=1 Tax=Henckelia pumila TaxID=405737 RepID=UPI003C6DF659